MSVRNKKRSGSAPGYAQTQPLGVRSTELRTALVRGLSFLHSEQAKNGSFPGLSGQYDPVQPFVPKRPSPTIFFTSLILNCLNGLSGTKVMRRHAAGFLLRERSDTWRWNYWMQQSNMRLSHPYPDDLDDIACALAALTGYDKDIIDGTVFGNVAQTLIAAEAHPGGPYYTWLHPDWQTIDRAVNANVGYFLSLHSVTLPGLDEYIDQSIKNDDYESEFYVGSLPVLYFISRWYSGSYKEQLNQRIIDEIDAVNNTPLAHSALALALLISSSCHMGIAPEFIYPLTRQLLALQKRGHWLAEALYRDPHIDGVDLYAGSAALTTAFALEALNNYQQYEPKKEVSSNRKITAAIPQSKSSTSLLDTAYTQYKQMFLRSNGSPEITKIADITAAAFGNAGKKVPRTTLDRLNAASIDGWISYSIYDNILDGTAKPELLGVANYAARTMIGSFSRAVDDTMYRQFVQDTLDKMDDANTWEVTYARARRVKGTVYIDEPVDYKDHSQLAHKSLGHLLASCGILVSLGYPVESDEMRIFQEFFFHFLIARQLNDDAHDWEDDLLSGRITPVVGMLMSSAHIKKTKIMAKDIEKLRLSFWQQTITDVSLLIHDHVVQAQRALERCTFLTSPKVFSSWLSALDAAATKAETGSAEAQKFIAAFGEMADTIKTKES